MAGPEVAGRAARKSRGCVLLGGGAILVVAVVVAVGVLIVKPRLDQAAAFSGALATASAYCGDLQAKNYAAAYGQLSSGYQANVSQVEFVDAAKLHDQLDGAVASCSVPRQQEVHGVQVTVAAVTLPATITRKQSATGPIRLAKQGEHWVLDTIPASLQGTDLAPLRVADAYCKTLVAGDYSTAYDMFTPAYQSARGAKTDFAARYKALGEDGVKITSCTSQLDTYTVDPGDNAAVVTTSLTLTLNGSTVSGGVRMALTLKLVDGAWKIDNVLTSAY